MSERDEHDWVSELLAESHEPAPPMPAEVAARLDDTLAGLVAERAQGDEDSERGVVVPLAPRRRRWQPALLAAAAVAVAAVGAGAMLQQTGQGSDSEADMATADTGSDAGGTSESAPDGEAAAGAAAPEEFSGAAGGALTDELSSKHSLAPAVRRLAVARAALRDSTADNGGATAGKDSALDRCLAPPVPTTSTSYFVTYDSRPATLVLGPRRGEDVETVRARVYTCDTAELLVDEQVTLP